jgi:hypothetical protein
MTTTQILRAAKDVILTRGWTRGDWDNERGEVCVMGAVNVATVGCARASRFAESDMLSARCETWSLLQRLLPSGFGISDWNDSRGRTPEDILDLFDRAIAFAEAEEVQPAPQDQTVRA